MPNLQQRVDEPTGAERLPYLGDMMLGERRYTLNRLQLDHLAAWAFKTILLPELSNRQRLQRRQLIDGYGASAFEFGMALPI